MTFRIARLGTLPLFAGSLLIVALAALPASPMPVSQQEPSDSSATDGATGVNSLFCLTCTGQGNGRIFGLIPNHGTTSALEEYKPVTVLQKFQIAFKDSTDPGTFAMAAAVAAIAQVRGSNPSYGQEFGGYSHYVATQYADYAISDFMREGIFPSLLHQDPRYFRRGTGSGRSRLVYAARQAFWTRSDSGRMGFNYSQTLGSATAVAISAAYSPETRDVRRAVCAFEMQIGAHVASNVMKEFWPDLNRAFLRKFQGNHP